MDIEPYNLDRHRPPVERFNARLAEAGSEFRFPTGNPSRGSAIAYDHFVVIEDGEVFGGYLLKHQAFFLTGERVDIENLQLPLSLGLIDKKYAFVSGAILFDVLGKSDFVYCLGLGSQESRLARMLTAAKWTGITVPFYFRIQSANRFARNIRLPANRVWMQRAMRTAGYLGLAGLGLTTMKWMRGTRKAPTATVETTNPPQFDQAEDRLFQEQISKYTLLGDRSATALNDWYPPSNSKFLRLRVSQGGRQIGWSVLLDTQMQDHKYFGNMRVGTIADCLADPNDAPAVVAASGDFLAQRGVDLIVSNQLHRAWAEALEQAGFRQGPSNFFLYLSPDLAERLSAIPGWEGGIHMNRGDGDGPIHL